MIFIEIFFEPRELWVVLRYYLTFLLQMALVCTYEVMRINYEKRLFIEKEYANSLMSAGRGHYHEMKELYETLSILHHDFKHHFKVMDELLQSGHVKEMEQYLANFNEQTPKDDLYYYCPNRVINALLLSYAKRCKQLDIQYNVSISPPEFFSIPDYDICVILGNLLENALEAAQKLESGRKIELAMKTDDLRLAIMVKNSFDGVVKEREGKLESTKKGGGLGLPGIQAIVNNHDGHILTEWDKNMFTFYVMLNISEPEA